jgi:hypothetical protein
MSANPFGVLLVRLKWYVLMRADYDEAEEKVYRPVRRGLQVVQQCRASPRLASLKEIEPYRRVVGCIKTLS